MTKPAVLISGAGIAGPALTRSGYDVVVVETADGWISCAPAVWTSAQKPQPSSSRLA